MPTVAVTGAAGLIAQSLMPRLAVDGRVVALDVREPTRRVRGVEVRLVDVARSDLRPVLEGAEVLVHLASIVDPLPDEALMARVNVHGTRRVLDAAAAVGVRKVVRVSGATVYGAWPGNPLPLREEHALRPNPGFTPAVHAVEAERLLLDWAAGDTDRVVTTMRTAPVMGPGADRLPSRLLLGHPRLRVRGAAPPVQAVHVDDLVDALERVIRDDHPGTFNVAADGWLDADAARALFPTSVVPAVPEEVLTRWLRVWWAVGAAEVPPTVVPYLVHPWVVANDRLRALGWTPAYTNEEAIRAGIAASARRARRGIRRGSAVPARRGRA